jgi:hypothetical protein
MPREKSPKQNQLRAHIAAAAARLMAQDGVDDFATAKRKAARMLGATDTHALPGNEEIEAELRLYQALYQGDEQRDRLVELRNVALDVMRAFAVFRPYLVGPVLKGTAGRYADIDLQLFPDSPKGVELHMVNRGIPYVVSEQRHFCGDEARQVSILKVDWDGIPINLAVYDANDERRVLKLTLGGRPIERAGISAVEALLNVRTA